MKNYIFINNQKIELTDEQVKQIMGAGIPADTKLSDIAVGDTAKIGNFEMVVLEQHDGEAAVLLMDVYGKDTVFGKNNNYNGSDVDEKCMEFAGELAKIIGWENIVLHKVDLTTDDGLKDYGTVERRASLLTADLYRRYVEILDKHKLDKWWWLATAHSTDKHGNSNWVRCVAPSGVISNFSYDSGDYGVRPFCILKSNIFVSK